MNRHTIEGFARRIAGASPRTKATLKELQTLSQGLEASAYKMVPGLMRARPRKITMAITAHCNLRCVGCRYGRDFMPGEQLSLETVTQVYEDAVEAGIRTVRLYGGEPLLHPDLPEMVRRGVARGLGVYVTTNGMLLRQKIDALYEAGLRSLTIGFYGVDTAYDTYVQRQGRFRRLVEGLDQVRSRYGKEFKLQLNFLLMKPSCSIEAVRHAWAFAERYDMTFHTDLIHYSLPYFTEGPERELQFTPEDAPEIAEVTQELIRLRDADPVRFPEPYQSLKSIPDWLLKGPEMKVPCDISKLIWIGADGSVQLCYVTFPLGNLRETRLRDMLFTDTHHRSARDAFELKCPNCHCERAERVMK
ncbi:MAG: radical SAM protein, partial [Alphaproteobacteria bacterium]|nr:radical SAM protein [Alphaproteobacteria bacterium]